MVQTFRSFFLNNVWLINLYPPFWGAGIKMMKQWNNDESIGFKVRLSLHFWNRNFSGTQFGGSLYSMCDPWYVFIMSIYFGEDYILWDRSAEIEYVRPGRTAVFGTFEIQKDHLERIRNEMNKGEKFFEFSTTLLDKKGEEIASVTKKVYIKPKLQN